MKKTTKEVVKGTGRYDEVIECLANIISDKWYQGKKVCITPYIKRGESVSVADYSVIVKESSKLLGKLVNDKFIHPMEFRNLSGYLDSTIDMHLHNYANAISHRENPEDGIKMETIRAMLITFQLAYFGTKDFERNVPDGWRKE